MKMRCGVLSAVLMMSMAAGSIALAQPEKKPAVQPDNKPAATPPGKDASQPEMKLPAGWTEAYTGDGSVLYTAPPSRR